MAKMSLRPFWHSTVDMVDLWEGRFQEVSRAIVFAQSASRGLSATAASCS